MRLPMMKIYPALALLSAIPLPAIGQYTSLQVPKQIQYQGRVATGTGGAWAGTEGYFVFALVQGATVLWNNWQGTASPADPGTVSPGAGQVLTLPVNQGVFSIRLGDGSGTNQQIPATVFFDSTANSVRSGVKLAVWFSPDDITFTRLSPDVEFASVPFAMVAGIAETVQARAVTTAMLADGSVNALKIAGNSVATANIQNGAIVSAKLSPDVTTPAGTVVAYIGDTAPTGWLLCDGTEVNRVGTYSNLATVVGTRFGTATDQLNKFKLPDFRGYFLRGVDSSPFDRDPEKTSRAAMASGGASGVAVGSVQDDDFKSHAHMTDGTNSGSKHPICANGDGGIDWLSNHASSNDADYFAGSRTGFAGGFETRPRNAYVNYIIKY